MTASAAQSVVRFGVFELDVAAGELRKQGRKINLQQQPLQVLAVLVRRPGEVVTREELQRALWPADTFVAFDQAVNTAILKIRQALDDSADNPRFIETLPRKGYRFIAPVQDAGGAVETSAPAWVRGRRLRRAAAVFVLLVAAAIAAWMLLDKGNETTAGALLPSPLTSYPGMELWPSFSPDGTQVAFQRGEWEDLKARQICVQLVGASEPLCLTQGAVPAWSPDGQSIAFLKVADKAGVFLISPLGGPERKLTELESADNLAWHPNGKWLVVGGVDAVGDSQALFWVSVETHEKRRLTSPPAGFSDWDPAVSPDGRAFVFTRGSQASFDLYLFELSEGLEPKAEPRRITSGDAINIQPAWTPDSDAIVFVSGVGDDYLYEMPLSGPAWRPGKPRRLPFAAQGVWSPTISRQGHLGYSIRTVDVNILRLELDGGRPASAPPKRLLDSTLLEYNPQYSPDGKRIAFVSTRSGQYEIWVCNSDGSGAMKLTSLGDSSSTYELNPKWSPDGRAIVFKSNPAGRADTFTIPSDGGKPELLFANSTVDSWSRDGRWIYFHRTGLDQVWKRRWPLSEQDGEAVQVTPENGSLARESPDGRTLYYLKNDAELWKLPVEGGEETQVLESGRCSDFALVEKGIYFMSGRQVTGPHSIEYLSFATGKVSSIAALSGSTEPGFSISPDGRWLLYSQLETAQGDLWMVENFR